MCTAGALKAVQLANFNSAKDGQVINRPDVAGAVLQTPLSLVNSVILFVNLPNR